LMIERVRSSAIRVLREMEKGQENLPGSVRTPGERLGPKPSGMTDLAHEILTDSSSIASHLQACAVAD
jgi:hypothetical protein